MFLANKLLMSSLMIITDFYIKNFRWLYIVFILTFCSAFGQTFFISLYSGEIRATFDLTHGQWGLIYSCATLSSAILILFVGGYADRISAKRLSTLVIFGLIVFVFLMANNTLHGASFYHSRPPFFWSRNAWAHINGLLWQMVF